MDASVSLPLDRQGEGLRVVEQVLLASKAVRRSLDELLSPAGCDGAEFLLLWNIAEQRQQSQCELADRLGCSNAQVSQLSDLLRRRGWLAAERDARDRRRQHWTLTNEGRHALHDSLLLLRGWCSRLEVAIGPLQFAPFSQSLQRLIAEQGLAASAEVSILPRKEAA